MIRVLLACLIAPTMALALYAQTMGPWILNGVSSSDAAVYSQLNAQAYSTLSACTATAEGTLAAINNSTTATYGAAIAGGGTNHVLAYCNGTAWTVH